MFQLEMAICSKLSGNGQDKKKVQIDTKFNRLKLTISLTISLVLDFALIKIDTSINFQFGNIIEY